MDVYGVALGAAAKREMVRLVDQLRAASVSADMSYDDRGLKGAMKGADRAGAQFALVLGDRELEAGEVAVKDLQAHEQTTVALADVVRHLQARLEV